MVVEMDFFVLACAMLFTVSGALKLVSIESFATSLEGLRVPLLASKFGRWLVPFFEVVLGLLFLFQVWLIPLASLAVVFLLLSTGVVVWNLIQGNRVPCNCFGSLSDSPISIRTVVRNLILIGLPLLVLWNEMYQNDFGHIDLPNRLAVDVVSLIIASLSIAASGLVFLRYSIVLSRLQTIESHLDLGHAGFAISTVEQRSSFPNHTWISPTQDEISRSSVQSENGQLEIVFVSSGCDSCKRLLSRLMELKIVHGSTVVVLVGFDPERHQEIAERLSLPSYAMKADAVANLYGVVQYPVKVTIDYQGNRLNEPVYGDEAIASSLAEAVFKAPSDSVQLTV